MVGGDGAEVVGATIFLCCIINDEVADQSVRQFSLTAIHANLAGELIWPYPLLP